MWLGGIGKNISGKGLWIASFRGCAWQGADTPPCKGLRFSFRGTSAWGGGVNNVVCCEKMCACVVAAFYANGGHNLWRGVYNQHVGGVALDAAVLFGWGVGGGGGLKDVGG